MAPQDNVGRIPKNAFIASISALLALALLGVLMRFNIRFRLQKQKLKLDDVLLLVAVAFLLLSIIIMYRAVISPMYMVMAMELRLEGVVPPPDIEDISQKYHMWSSICLTTTWCAFSAVKLSFLVFFKRLIDRIPRWQIYWWVITIFTISTLAYGVTVYFIGCPYFFDAREAECSSGHRKRIILIQSVLLMVLDTIGDLLSMRPSINPFLVIPIGIIWKIQVVWSQKIILTCSLCLTVIMIILSIVRVSGLVYRGFIDSIWETYWQFLSAEVGVFLAASIAFRSFFTARSNSRPTPHYSVKRLLKESITGEPTYRQRNNPSNMWLEGSFSELQPLSQNNRAGNITRHRNVLSRAESEDQIAIEAQMRTGHWVGLSGFLCLPFDQTGLADIAPASS
ncbi:hypothetical protein P170DRAFT_483688 [Aspergillus steynii IBT 23096]|uniref:Rhodopsin domain-containing protein n=1 Tax=Aspergillus steynii IBT 23096 TaxID=1392250 RepID=A0A2I2GPU7_9EURO|nr:uncharacterized protein P170DRAFT_483688 [Aspergillus steynii IBT 23096]PLB54899.1 hypothetical protein P170DRAFT_483688 [Aspergillus steynii IBT 23096]